MLFAELNFLPCPQGTVCLFLAQFCFWGFPLPAGGLPALFSCLLVWATAHFVKAHHTTTAHYFGWGWHSKLLHFFARQRYIEERIFFFNCCWICFFFFLKQGGGNVKAYTTPCPLTSLFCNICLSLDSIQSTNVSLREGENYHLLPRMLNIVWKLLARQGWAN